MSDSTQSATTHTSEGGSNPRPQHRYPTVNRQNKSITVKTLVAVHKDYVGAVIGREGKTINKIKDDTQTRISYMDEDYSKGHQSPAFLISGAPQGVQRAEKWVRKILQSTYEAEQGNTSNETSSTEEGTQ
tara:strand:+ start:366 stop:755 length:390 start_codon:yes stop_codon:yes gene_type:complete